MSWILFVIQLVIYAPKLIAAVREIWELIKLLPKEERKDAKARLMDIAKRSENGKNTVSQSEMDEFKAELRCRVGK